MEQITVQMRPQATPSPADSLTPFAHFSRESRFALTFWPQKRQSKGEFSETEYGEWQETD